MDEYNDLHKEIRDYKNGILKAKNDAEYTAAKARADADNSIRQVRFEADQEIDKLKQAVKTERAGKEYQIGLNQRLLQISRERANAERKIKPKKERSGYRVLSSRQKKYRYKESRNSWGEVYLWETVIQTPYVVDFTAEQAMKETKELFGKNDSGERLIGRLGIAGEYNGSYEDMIDDPRCSELNEYNIIVEKNYKANVKAGYWEIIITHTKPLNNMSSELM